MLKNFSIFTEQYFFTKRILLFVIHSYFIKLRVLTISNMRILTPFCSIQYIFTINSNFFCISCNIKSFFSFCLQAKKEMYDVKKQRLCLAQDEYKHLNNALSTLAASRTSRKYNNLQIF